MRMRSFTGIVLLALAIAGCGKGGGAVGLTAAAKSYDLQVNVKAGDVYPYSISLQGGGPGESLDGMVSMKVLKVDGANTTFEVKFDSVKMPPGTDPAMQAMVEQALTKASSTTTVDKRWNTVNKSGQGAVDMSAVSLPSKPIKVGDTWDAKSSGAEMSGKAKFVSVENIGSREIAVLEVTGAKDDTLGVAGPITYKVEAGTGMPWELSFSATEEGKTSSFSLKRAEAKPAKA